MNNGGTSPTNMFESLATHLRQRFYPRTDAGKMDWFDVHPAGVYQSQVRTTILSVQMQHANGIYSRPEWSSTEGSLAEDWRALINETIARGQAAVSATEAAENARTAKRRS